MDVELLDDIIAEASNDLLQEEVRPESEWMALLTFHFITNRVEMMYPDDSKSVLEAMRHICMMTFGASRFTIWNPLFENPLLGLKADPGMMLLELKSSEGMTIHPNAMRAQIPLSFESIREVSCFLNLIARAFATSIDCITIDNGLYQCELGADQIHEIHKIHYYPEQVDFGVLYRTLVVPWFPTEERKRTVLETYYKMPLERFILKQTIIPSFDRNNKNVELPFINDVLGKRVTQQDSEERVIEITHGWWGINHDKISDHVKSYLFDDNNDDSRSCIRHIIGYMSHSFVTVLFLLRGPIFLEDKIWICTGSIPMSKDALTLDDFKKRMKTYNILIEE